MKSLNIVFHIGYPKAASTTLQKSLFNAHSEIINLGVYPTGNIGRDSKDSKQLNAPILNDSRIRELYQICLRDDEILFNKDLAVQIWQSLLTDYAKGKSTVVFSNERFLSPLPSNLDFFEKAQRVREVFASIKILIIIRSQLDILKSKYRDHPFDARFRHGSKPISFSEWLEIDLQQSHFSHSDTLLFNNVVSFYEQLFSKEQILVLPMEFLKQDQEKFAQELSAFLDIGFEETSDLLRKKHENQGVSTLGNRYRKWRSYLLPHLNFLGPTRTILKGVDRYIFNRMKLIGKTENITASENDLLRLQEKFSKDNALLAERRKLPLAKLGYFTDIST